MHAVPEEAGPFESMAHEGKRVLVINPTTIALICIGAFYVWFVARLMWDDDEMRLATTRKLIAACQSIARHFGQMAIDLEHGYNEYVEVLH